MKTNLLLSDLLKNNNIDPSEVVLIRHVLSRDDCKECYDKGFIKSRVHK